MARCEIVLGPIVAWPGMLRSDQARTEATFRATWVKTERLLEREVVHLGADRCELLLAHPARAFRLDGGLGARYAGSEPAHPGVVIAIPSPEHGRLTYATDAFTEWRDNVRAVALALEALRLCDRYGVADRGQQYVGFAALGTGMAMGAKPAPMTLDDAAALLAGAVGGTVTSVLDDRLAARAAYREAVRLLHPDVGGSGDGEKMARLDEAWSLVQEHHGLRAATG